ncbi:hypothetical protein FRB99_006913 [Tulasnella sp. 403]|nr:hypothetical protein FRB99_006913 [Tulasnella sp. 403]
MNQLPSSSSSTAAPAIPSSSRASSSSGPPPLSPTRPLKRSAEQSQSTLQSLSPTKRARGEAPDGDPRDEIEMQEDSIQVDEQLGREDVDQNAVGDSGKVEGPQTIELSPETKAVKYQQDMEEELLRSSSRPASITFAVPAVFFGFAMVAHRGIIDVLLRTYPEKQRSQSERDQADDIYSPSMSISIPPPKPATQEGIISLGHALTVHPITNLGGVALSHLQIRRQILSTRGILTMGHHQVMPVPHLCVANYLSSAHLRPANSNLLGLIQFPGVYEAFSHNLVEVDVLFDWLREDGRGPRGILLDMIEDVQKEPGAFQRLVAEGIFTKLLSESDDGSSVAPPPPAVPPLSGTTQPGTQEQSAPPSSQAEVPQATSESTSEAAPTTHQDGGNPAPENNDNAAPPPAPVADNGIAAEPPAPPTPVFERICRECANDLFAYRLYEWWANERAKVIAAANADQEAASNAETAPTEPSESQPASGAVPTDAPPADPPMTIRGLPVWILGKDRKDCPEGRNCASQRDAAHSREFNHVIAPPRVDPPAIATTGPEASIVVPPPAPMMIVEDEDDGDEAMDDAPAVAAILAHQASQDASSVASPTPIPPETATALGSQSNVPPTPLPDPTDVANRLYIFTIE